MLVQIKDIKIRKRVRKDLGNLEDLKDSLRTYGLLNPITLNGKYELIAGERRLQAAIQLGWTSIQANIIENISDVDQLEMEIEENNQRKLGIRRDKNVCERRKKNGVFKQRLCI